MKLVLSIRYAIPPCLILPPHPRPMTHPMGINVIGQIQVVHRNLLFQVKIGNSFNIRSIGMFFSFLEHFSQVLLNYFKQLHGEQIFSEMIFRMSVKGILKITIEDILQKDLKFAEQEIK